MNKQIRKMLYEMSFRTGILNRTLFNMYPYMHQPHQLRYLLDCMDHIRDTPGVILEIGCAHGATTIFLKKYLKHLGIERRYVAIDTFAGFSALDVEHEILQRNKSPTISEYFRSNKKKWVERSLTVAGVDGVELIESDCSKFDYGSLGGVAFCLIDVDLYKPVCHTLDTVYAELNSGGRIVVDDCQPHDLWDGALQAYNEFVENRGLQPQLQADKYGVIDK